MLAFFTDCSILVCELSLADEILVLTQNWVTKENFKDKMRKPSSGMKNAPNNSASFSQNDFCRMSTLSRLLIRSFAYGKNLD